MNRQFTWLDGCTVKACIFSLLSFPTLAETCIETRLSQNTFSTSCFSLEQSIEHCGSSREISSHLISVLLFSSLACVPHETKGKRPNSPSFAPRPKFSSSIEAWLPQDCDLSFSLSKYCSDIQNTFFAARCV